MFKERKEESKMFELVMCVRDKDGNKTTRTKSVSTDSPQKLWEFYNRMNPRVKKKKKRKSKAANRAQLKEAQVELEQHYEELDKKRAEEAALNKGQRLNENV